MDGCTRHSLSFFPPFLLSACLRTKCVCVAFPNRPISLTHKPKVARGEEGDLFPHPGEVFSDLRAHGALRIPQGARGLGAITQATARNISGHGECAALLHAPVHVVVIPDLGDHGIPRVITTAGGVVPRTRTADVRHGPAEAGGQGVLHVGQRVRGRVRGHDVARREPGPRR